MSRTLILMRHAKSSWDDPKHLDHDRPLNARGQRSAAKLGRWLNQKGYIPDEALISSARRTVETFERLNLPCKSQVAPRLFLAGASRILDVLRSGSGQTVLLLAHNPGIAEFAERIVEAPPSHPRFEDYPTGATLIAQMDIQDWKEADWGSGTVLDFVIPREL